MRFDITDQFDQRPTALEWAEDALPELAEWLKAEPGRELGGTTFSLQGYTALHLVEDTDARFEKYGYGINAICKDRAIDGDPVLHGLPDRFTICDRCLKKIGIDTKQEETAIQWGLKNLDEPWKVLELLEDPDLWEMDRRRIWRRWYQLTIEAGEWSEDWETYTQPEFKWYQNRGHRNTWYQDAGCSNPYFFVNRILGWYRPTKYEAYPEVVRMSKDWHGPTPIAFARMLERLLWLLGEGPPTLEQVRSKAEVTRQILKLRDRRFELLDKLARYSRQPLEEPFARRDDRDDPIFGDLL